MNSKFKIQNSKFILIFILLIAAIMRLYDYSEWSFSNDELSALCRLRFGNIRDVINFGVRPDGHPAGVQVFLFYWTKMFGYSESIIRLPFVFAGILSVLFSYLIASKWFNKNAGLMSALTMSFLQFTILYSELARPYSFGLLFSLSTVYFWTIIIFRNLTSRSFIIHYLLFIFSTVLAAYTHHFSAFFVFIVYVTGLFFVQNSNNKSLRLKYYLSAIICIILYLPHAGIFLGQLSFGGNGGPGGWLGKPDINWLPEFIYFAFNCSALLLILIALLIIFFIFLQISSKNFHFTKFHFLSIIWFFIPFLTGYFYSVIINPVLQNSVMIFSFPFLLFFIFSFMPEKHSYISFLTIVIFGLAGIYSTVFINNFYKIDHFGNFKGVAKDLAEWNKKYSSNNITYSININSSWYINYYLKDLNTKVEFKQSDNRGGKDLLALKHIIENSNTSYFAFAWLKPSPEEIPDIIQVKYPYMIKHNNYNDFSEDYLFSINDSINAIKPAKPDFYVFNGFESKKDLWGADSSLLCKDILKHGQFCVKIDKNVEYGPTFAIQLFKIPVNPLKKIKISLWALTPVSSNNLHLVLSVEKSASKSLIYVTSEFRNYVEKNKWSEVFLDYTFVKSPSSDNLLKIYVWNEKKEIAYIDDIKISFYANK